MQVLLNLIAFVVEAALIAAIAYLGYYNAQYFAALIAVLTLVLGAQLEYARFSHEMPFYFGAKLAGVRAVIARIWTAGDALVKAAVAGFVALLTFSGTDAQRLQWTAILFAIVLFIGTTALLRVTIGWRAGARRWGYFRLGLPLGVAFSAGIYLLGQAGLIKTTSVTSVAFNAAFGLSERTTLEKAGEFLFQLSQATDAVIAQMLAQVMPEAYVPIVQIIASTNVLPGFILAVATVSIVRIAGFVQDVGLPRTPTEAGPPSDR